MASRSLIKRLEQVAPRFGEGLAAPKLELLERLEVEPLSSAKEVRRFHEVLCYLRALPDDRRVLSKVESLLTRFSSRADLRRHRQELVDSGIAGTDLRSVFYAQMARWLIERWGAQVTIDWSRVEDHDRLLDRVYALALDAETPGLDHAHLTARQWIERSKAPEETDAAFFIRRFTLMGWDPTLRDQIYDELELPLCIRAGVDTPSRTHARLSGGKRNWQTVPPSRSRPDLRKELSRPPLSIVPVSPRRGREIIDLTREAMVLRDRDLDAFAGGNPRDVRLVDCGDGLEFAVIGVLPEWRMLLEAVYGWLILRNRVPVGYVLVSALLRSSEIAFNVFDTWRGGDAAYVYGRVLATARTLFGAETFTIYPYQLGRGNPEGLLSGAWWFYQKLGFRPRDPAVLRLMKSELDRLRRNPRHRSSLSTLEKLASANLFLETGRRKRAVIGTFAFDRVGLAVTDYLAERFGSKRNEAEEVCAEESARALGAKGWRSFPREERKAWLRLSPLLCILRGADRWTAEERRALVALVRAKGGRRESDFVRLFDAHPKLGRGLERLATNGFR